VVDDFEALPELRDARPGQTDVVARHLEARIRESLAGTPAEPIRIDRFIVLERLGAGATGVVFAAFDPRLDRKVALKLVRTDGDAARERMLAEAQAMAKLSDPNVVAVYDASEASGELYIAMELVAGCDARRWLAAQPRSIEAIVAVFVRAGRGLATAHAAGLIHGDVKPENILVGDGLVKVADFGLARAETTAAAMRGGTLAYMAPEQLATGASVHSDQYAFAASLYEAISGARPPARGDPPPLDAPPHVARAVDRALSRAPAARYPSMIALLDVLAPPAPRHRRGIWVGALALPAAAVVAIALHSTASADRCGGGDTRLAAAWPLVVRAELAPAVTRALDDYGRRWAEMSRSTCEATQRGEQSAAMLDLRMSCLDRRLDELAAFVAAAPRSRTGPAATVASAAFALSPIEPCADRDRLAGVLPPPARRATVAELRGRIDRDRARQHTPEAGAALDDIERLIAEARALGYPPVLGEALLVRGYLQRRAGRFTDAAESFKAAAEAAGAGHDDDTLVDAWTQRAYIVGYQLAHRDEGLAYLAAAEALAARAKLPALQRAAIRQTAGEIFGRAQNLADGRAALEEAVRLYEQARGSEHPSVAHALSLLVTVCVQQDDLKAARSYAERARAIVTTALGPSPETAAAVNALAEISWAERDPVRAIAEFRQALDIERAIGDERGAAVATSNIGDNLRVLGRMDEARSELERALAMFGRTTGLDDSAAIWTLASLARATRDPAEARRRFEEVLARRIALLGPEHGSVADTINDLGNLARDSGDLAAATGYYERALPVYEKAFGPDHPHVSVALSNLGEVALLRKRFDDALRVCSRARTLDEARLGANHPDLAYDLACLGEARLGLGDARGAVALLERAVELGRPLQPDDRARAEFALARALWAAGGDRARARALAAAAAPAIRPPAQRPVIERWLAEHGRPPVTAATR
jgi:tetratricopeptide (TPR) repeat protein